MPEEVMRYIERAARVVFERAPVKGIDGFKVESQDDDPMVTFKQAEKLYNLAKEATKDKEEVPCQNRQ